MCGHTYKSRQSKYKQLSRLTVDMHKESEKIQITREVRWGNNFSSNLFTKTLESRPKLNFRRLNRDKKGEIFGYTLKVRRFVSSKVHESEGSLVRRFVS